MNDRERQPRDSGWTYLFDTGVPWTGEWPGVAECREFGLWCYGPPWIPCSKEHPRATEDMNRLVQSCVWSKEQRRWVKP